MHGRAALWALLLAAFLAVANCAASGSLRAAAPASGTVADIADAKDSIDSIIQKIDGAASEAPEEDAAGEILEEVVTGDEESSDAADEAPIADGSDIQSADGVNEALTGEHDAAREAALATTAQANEELDQATAGEAASAEAQTEGSVAGTEAPMEGSVAGTEAPMELSTDSVDDLAVSMSEGNTAAAEAEAAQAKDAEASAETVEEPQEGEPVGEDEAQVALEHEAADAGVKGEGEEAVEMPPTTDPEAEVSAAVEQQDAATQAEASSEGVTESSPEAEQAMAEAEADVQGATGDDAAVIQEAEAITADAEPAPATEGQFSTSSLTRGSNLRDQISQATAKLDADVLAEVASDSNSLAAGDAAVQSQAAAKAADLAAEHAKQISEADQAATTGSAAHITAEAAREAAQMDAAQKLAAQEVQHLEAVEAEEDPEPVAEAQSPAEEAVQAEESPAPAEAAAEESGAPSTPAELAAEAARLASDVTAKAAEAEAAVAAAKAKRDAFVANATADAQRHREEAVEAATEDMTQARSVIENAKKAMLDADEHADRVEADAAAVADAEERKTVAGIRHELEVAKAEEERAVKQAEAAESKQQEAEAAAAAAVANADSAVSGANASSVDNSNSTDPVAAQAEQDSAAAQAAADGAAARASKALDQLRESVDGASNALKQAFAKEEEAEEDEDDEEEDGEEDEEEDSVEAIEAEGEAADEEADEAADKAADQAAAVVAQDAAEANEAIAKEEEEAQEDEEEAEDDEEAEDEDEEADDEDEEENADEVRDEAAEQEANSEEQRFRESRAHGWGKQALESGSAVGDSVESENQAARGVAAILDATQQMLSSAGRSASSSLRGASHSVIRADTGRAIPRFMQISGSTKEAPRVRANRKRDAPAPRFAQAAVAAAAEAKADAKAKARDINIYGSIMGTGTRMSRLGYGRSGNGYAYPGYGPSYGYPSGGGHVTGSSGMQPYWPTKDSDSHRPEDSIVAPYPTLASSLNFAASTSPSPTPPGAFYQGQFGDQAMVPGYSFKQQGASRIQPSPAPNAALKPAPRPVPAPALLQARAHSQRIANLDEHVYGEVDDSVEGEEETLDKVPASGEDAEDVIDLRSARLRGQNNGAPSLSVGDEIGQAMTEGKIEGEGSEDDDDDETEEDTSGAIEGGDASSMRADFFAHGAQPVMAFRERSGSKASSGAQRTADLDAAVYGEVQGAVDGPEFSHDHVPGSGEDAEDWADAAAEHARGVLSGGADVSDSESLNDAVDTTPGEMADEDSRSHPEFFADGAKPQMWFRQRRGVAKTTIGDLLSASSGVQPAPALLQARAHSQRIANLDEHVYGEVDDSVEGEEETLDKVPASGEDAEDVIDLRSARLRGQNNGAPSLSVGDEIGQAMTEGKIEGEGSEEDDDETEEDTSGAIEGGDASSMRADFFAHGAQPVMAFRERSGSKAGRKVAVNLAQLLQRGGAVEAAEQMRFARRLPGMVGNTGLSSDSPAFTSGDSEGFSFGEDISRFAPKPKNFADHGTTIAEEALAPLDKVDNADVEESELLRLMKRQARGIEDRRASGQHQLLSLMQTEAVRAKSKSPGAMLPVDIFKSQNPVQDYVTNSDIAMAANANAYMYNSQPIAPTINEMGEPMAGATPTASPSPEYFRGFYEPSRQSFNFVQEQAHSAVRPAPEH